MSREPAIIAKYLLIVFTTGLIAFGGLMTFAKWQPAEALNVLVSFAFVPWIVGPAALAAFLVARARSRVEGWLLLGAEVVLVASTLGLWTMLFLHPDGQNALAILFYPVPQFAGLLIYAVAVTATALHFR